MAEDQVTAPAPPHGDREPLEQAAEKLQRIVRLCARPSNVDHIEALALEAIALISRARGAKP